MSALWAPLQAPLDDRPARGGKAGPKARGLRSVPALPERMARIPFITVLIAIFGVGMVGLLVVNTSLQNQAFESRALNRQAAQLVYAEAELQSQLNQVRSPEQIATKASALGMRANPYPAFLVVPSGKVIGAPLASGSLREATKPAASAAMLASCRMAVRSGLTLSGDQPRFSASRYPGRCCSVGVTRSKAMAGV